MENKVTRKKYSTENRSSLYLGAMEEMLYIGNEKFEGTGTGTCVIRLNGIIEKDRLEKALLIIQKRHPKLRSAIHKDNLQRPYFHVYEGSSIPSIPLIVDFLDQEEISWEKETIKESNEIFDASKGHLCKIKVLIYSKENICDVIGTFHHSILDVASLSNFFNELFSQYELLENEKTGGLEQNDLPSLPIISGKITDTKLSFRDKLKAIIAGFSLMLQKKPNLLQETTDKDSQFFFKIVLTESETNALQKQCEEKAVGLQSALCAAGLLSARQLLEQEKVRLSCISALNTRKLFEPVVGDEHLGCFVNSFRKVCVLKKDESFWELARKYGDSLIEFIYKGGPLRNAKMMEQVGISEKWFKAPRDTMTVSNLGIAKLKSSYGSLRVEEISLVGNAKEFGPLIGILAIIVGGRLNLSLGGIYLKPETAQCFADNFRKVIKEIIGETDECAERGKEASSVDSQPVATQAEPVTDVLTLLNEIFIEIFEDDTLEITPEMIVRDVEGWDSLQQVRIMVAIEEKFNIRVPVSQIIRLSSIGELVELIESLKS